MADSTQSVQKVVLGLDSMRLRKNGLDGMSHGSAENVASIEADTPTDSSHGSQPDNHSNSFAGGDSDAPLIHTFGELKVMPFRLHESLTQDSEAVGSEGVLSPTSSGSFVTAGVLSSAHSIDSQPTSIGREDFLTFQAFSPSPETPESLPTPDDPPPVSPLSPYLPDSSPPPPSSSSRTLPKIITTHPPPDPNAPPPLSDPSSSASPSPPAPHPTHSLPALHAPLTSHPQPSTSLPFSANFSAQPSPPSSLSPQADAPPSVSLSRRCSTTSSQHEDDTWESWRQHKRHFFILNSAGKPIFTRYGDDHALAGFMAIIQAIISVVQDQGDTLRHVQAGSCLIVFLLKGPIYLVAASRAGEPLPVLQRQLELLYSQIIFIVTSNLERVCARNPGYDARQLLGGTWGVLHSLLKSFSLDPGYLMEAMSVLPLPLQERREAGEALAEAVKRAGALYGLILADGHVVVLEKSRGAPPMHPSDLLLLTNFITSNESYRYRFGESFSPVCLPHFRASAFLHAYIRYLDPDSGCCLLLLSASPESFHGLSEGRALLEERLEGSAVMGELQQRLEAPGGGRVRLENLPRMAGGGAVGATPLWHFLLKLTGHRQLVCPAFREPLSSKGRRKEVVRAYARMHSTVWAAGAGKPLRLFWQVDDNWSLLAVVERDSEVYLVLDPLVDKEVALRVAEGLRRFLLDKARLAELLLPA